MAPLQLTRSGLERQIDLGVPLRSSTPERHIPVFESYGVYLGGAKGGDGAIRRMLPRSQTPRPFKRGKPPSWYQWHSKVRKIRDGESWGYRVPEPHAGQKA